MSDNNSSTVNIKDLVPFEPNEMFKKLQQVDISTLNNIHPKFDLPKIDYPNIVSFEERIKPVIQELNQVKGELQIQTQKLNEQTSELKKLRYENNLINAQLHTANITIDRQLTELNKLHNINNELNQTNETLKENNRHSLRNGIVIGLIPSVIILIITVILTRFGVL